MAMTFFTGGANTSGMDAMRPAGYDSNQFLDAGIIEQLRSSGYILTPTAYTATYAVQNFSPINKVVIGTKSVPAFQDMTGNIYVIDERQIVYLLEKSAINPSTGVPTNVVTDLGAGPTIPFTPVAPSNPVVPTTPVVGPPLTYTPPPVTPPVFPVGPTTPPPPPPGGVVGSGKIYTAFTVDDVVPNQQETVTRALWSNNVGNLTTFFTSSLQTAAQKTYYYEIWNSSSLADCGAEPQFSIAYGNRLGSGSVDDGGQIEDTPTRAIYGQTRLLCLDPTEESFIIDGTSTDSIYVINVNRARMREYLDEGNIEINIAHLSGSEFIADGNPASAHTGSNVTLSGNGEVLRLIDDSSLNPATIKQSGEVYNIVSGSIEDGVYNPSNPHVYGQLFRRKGIIVLDGTRLDASASFATVTGREVAGDNAFKLFTAVSGAALYDDGSGDPLGFQGRGAERVKSTYYYVRAKNAEYNFSNNPTFVSGSSGDLRHPEMFNDPSTYITTVGLYNNNKELIAVAKMSQPIKKSFKQEALIQVKLDF